MKLILTLGAMILAEGCTGTGIGLVQWGLPQEPSSEEMIPDGDTGLPQLSDTPLRKVSRVDPYRYPARIPSTKRPGREYSYLRYDDFWVPGNRVEQFLQEQELLSSTWRESRSGLWSPPSTLFGP